MAKSKAMKGRKETRKIRDLTVKPGAVARVKGGATSAGKKVKVDIHI